MPELDAYLCTGIPDFLVKLKNGLSLVLEVKGFEDEQSRAKHEAAKRWCTAVSAWGEMGKWEFVVCKNPTNLNSILASFEWYMETIPQNLEE